MQDINPPPKKTGGRNPTGKRRPDEDSYRFRNEVLALRKEGLSFPQIAKRLDRTQGYIYKTYQASLKSIVIENIVEVRKLEIERLDELQIHITNVLKSFTPMLNQGQIVYDYIEDDYGNYILDEAGNRIRIKLQDYDIKMKAVAGALKIMERRARLLGLDAPTKISATDPTGEKEAAVVQFFLPLNNRDEPPAT